MDIDWNAELVDQLDWHWQHQLRPRLDGLTDDEYFWQPVPGCWTLSRRGESSAPVSLGTGEFTMDYATAPRDREPVTTIAWRLAHLIDMFGPPAAPISPACPLTARPSATRVPRRGRCARSTRGTMRGSATCAAWAQRGSPGRKARSHRRSMQMRRWPGSSSTPTWKSSTMARKSACCAISICGKTAEMSLGIHFSILGEAGPAFALVATAAVRAS
jgi:hypothetical protein